MADGIVKFVLSKADPITFFGGSSSQSKVDPYTISLTSSSSDPKPSSPSSSSGYSSTYSSSATNHSSPPSSAASSASQMMRSPAQLHGLLADKEGPDFATHLLESYVYSLVSSPLIVVETLAEVQYQRKEEDSEADSELAAYETIHPGTTSTGPISKIPILNGGVWDNVRDVVESEGEGWLALLKGHLTAFIYNGLFLYMQPALEEALNDALDVYDDSHPVTHVLSHMVVGGTLSPLELIRTRLIVQTSVHAHKRYYGPVHAFAAITAEEGGGLGALYGSQHLLPTVVLHGVRSLLRVLSSRIISDDLGLNPDFNPVLHKFAVLLFMAVEVGIVSPFEMARKRLQVQKLRGGMRVAGEASQPFRASIEMAPKVYSGIWAAIYGIITEEGPQHRRRRKANRAKSAAAASSRRTNLETFNPSGAGDWQDLYDLPSETPRRVKKGSFQRLGKYWQGIASLYRGFWARYASEVVRFAFQELRENEEWLI
ncbi:hypothetical protein HDU67_007779 [Dinochytrium kinnereticum]|nr:hypothetical protein HDU67_007779 [Dinochytrium kinnereticum]